MGGWESVEREKDNWTNNTVSPSPAQNPSGQPEACHAPARKQRLSFFNLIYKNVFLIKKKKFRVVVK
jgi:hypothetical protein